ncbi:hypothetical protein Clacol_005775 [Clathrus columnatus]|uniref:15-cis-phytoene synthase n=1 Tax=Clathrus columnatus TaxID=1419009 RepID=A0AAV5AGC2_9AGAM|nr:hypothetical protein Clacol_005775 [Clathrus columnatus]
MDDLVDEASNTQSAEEALAIIESFIDKTASDPLGYHSTPDTFSYQDRSTFMLLPPLLHYIPVNQFTQLLQGFKTDIQFFKAANISEFPIQTENDLVQYCECVASTVGRMFVYATWNAESAYPVSTCRQEWVLKHATKMGIALQLINVARDIIQDARNGRLYVPLDWAKSLEERAELDELVNNPDSPAAASAARKYSLRLVQMARFYYNLAVTALDSLPSDCIKGARLAVDVYMGIGEEILKRHGDVSQRVSLSRIQRMEIALKVLYK